MSTIASQITSLTIVYSIVYSDVVQRKHQSSVSLAFVRGIHRGPVNSPHKWPVTRKMFPFDDVIMLFHFVLWGLKTKDVELGFSYLHCNCVHWHLIQNTSISFSNFGLLICIFHWLLVTMLLHQGLDLKTIKFLLSELRASKQNLQEFITTPMLSNVYWIALPWKYSGDYLIIKIGV